MKAILVKYFPAQDHRGTLQCGFLQGTLIFPTLHYYQQSQKLKCPVQVIM